MATIAGMSQIIIPNAIGSPIGAHDAHGKSADGAHIANGIGTIRSLIQRLIRTPIDGIPGAPVEVSGLASKAAI